MGHVSCRFTLLCYLAFLVNVFVLTASTTFIRKYEKLDYRLPTRQKRSLSDPVHISFESHGQTFHLVLVPDDDTLPAAQTFVNDKLYSPTISGQPFLYSGYLKGKPRSFVFGSLIDGVFDGTVHTDEGIFYVERSSKYFRPNESQDFHSLIYHENDVDEEKLRRRRSLYPGCGLSSDIKNQMEAIQRSAIADDTSSSHDPQSVKATNRVLHSAALEEPLTKYLGDGQFVRRAKRQDDVELGRDANGIYAARTCALSIQTDQKLWDYVFQNEGAGDGNKTTNEILSLVHNHVKAVNVIYGETDFDGIRGISFQVQRVKIFDSNSCKTNSSNPFCPRLPGQEDVDVSTYLNLNSMQDHSEFCLHYAITYRDFNEGTLGLAWVASPSPCMCAATHGGICEVYKTYSEKGNRIQRSLNTGIITLVNYNSRVPPRVSQLTLAHEIGHNFGANHDPGAEGTVCRPGYRKGNYIMFASATSGDKKNNAEFSPCSKQNISAVLGVVLRERPTTSTNVVGKRNCFTGSQTAFCGNQLVEEGEECDCGFQPEDCAKQGDSCCYSKKDELDVVRPRKGGMAGCTLKHEQGARCSPSEGVCCNSACQFRAGVTCLEAGECNYAQTCDGSKATCPTPAHKADLLPCKDNTSVCHAGMCNGSICEKINMVSCFLQSKDNAKKCELACMNASGNPEKDCTSSFDIPALRPYYQAGINGIKLKPGSPCDNYLGYCDVLYKCRSIDSDGPLSRLKKYAPCYGSAVPDSLQRVGRWIEVHWWAVVLIGIGFILLMALFIKCCAVHTPSSNPNRAPAHSIYETLRRPTTLLPGHRGGHHRHRHHRHHSSRNNVTTSEGATNGAGAVQPAQIEPPPPYSAVVRDASPAASAPPRGHRKHRKPRGEGENVEMKAPRRAL